MVNVTVPWGTVTYFQLNMGHLAYNHPETKVKTISNLDIVLSFVSFPAQSALHSSLVADWKSSLPALCVIDPVLVEIIRQMKYFSKTRWLCQPKKKKTNAWPGIANWPGWKFVCVWMWVYRYWLSAWITQYPVVTPVSSAMPSLPANENTHSVFLFP